MADHVRLVDRMAKGDEAGAVKTLRDHLVANLARLSLDPAPARSVDLAAALRPGEAAAPAGPGKKRPVLVGGT